MTIAAPAHSSATGHSSLLQVSVGQQSAGASFLSGDYLINKLMLIK